MKFSALLVGVLLILTGCGDGGSTDVDTTVLDTTTVATTATTVRTVGSAATTVAPDQVGPVDLASYVAALEDALVGTAYEGEVLQSPEVFLATGALFCDQLDSGMTPDEVLTLYLETLTNGPVERAVDDDLAMAGGVLGVGVVTLCPQYSATVAGSS